MLPDLFTHLVCAGKNALYISPLATRMSAASYCNAFTLQRPMTLYGQPSEPSAVNPTGETFTFSGFGTCCLWLGHLLLVCSGINGTPCSCRMRVPKLQLLVVRLLGHRGPYGTSIQVKCQELKQSGRVIIQLLSYGRVLAATHQ